MFCDGVYFPLLVVIRPIQRQKCRNGDTGGEEVFFFFFLFCFLIRVLLRIQEYFTYTELTVHQRWAKIGEPGEKPPDGAELSFPTCDQKEAQPQW